MKKLWVGVITMIVANISCASKSGFAEEPKSLNSDSAYSQVVSHPLSNKVPLGGSFEAGVAILQSKDASQEAASVYKKLGVTLLSTQDTVMPPGIQSPDAAKKLLDNKNIKFVTIPATGDVVANKAMSYHLLTRKFAAEFNLRMLELSNLGSK